MRTVTIVIDKNGVAIVELEESQGREFEIGPLDSLGGRGKNNKAPFAQNIPALKLPAHGFRPNSLLTLSFDGIQCLLYLRGVMARAD